MLTKGAESYIEKIFNERSFLEGNGREVRNYFERIVRNQSRRLNRLKEFNKEILMTIEKDDIASLSV